MPSGVNDRLAVLDRVTVNRADGSALFRDLSCTFRNGEAWAIVGPTGSGKTILADVLSGRRRPDSGTVSWPRFNDPASVIRRVAFKEDSRRFSYSRHYYQQRFNFIEPHDDVTLDAFLRQNTSASENDLLAATAKLGVEALLPLSLIKLSNGQMRRARIARALLSKPQWLLLDDPFLALDAEGRADVAELLGGLVRLGLPVLLLTARREELPAWVTHVLPLAASRSHRDVHDNVVIPDTTRALRRKRLDLVVELNRVCVAYGDRIILNDITWTVRAGERWAVLGPNGSGKSSLLSLLYADHPQAYANDVRLFGKRRGSGECIWDVKKQIGFVSPELHLYFPADLSAAQTVATGFFDLLVPRPTSIGQDSVIRDLFEQFGLTALAERRFSQLSTGEQRLVLLVRALVKSPPLLILDEPFQGLDRQGMTMARDWLDTRLRPEQTLLFVSHDEAEIPWTVSHRLRLDAGRVTS